MFQKKNTRCPTRTKSRVTAIININIIDITDRVTWMRYTSRAHKLPCSINSQKERETNLVYKSAANCSSPSSIKIYITFQKINEQFDYIVKLLSYNTIYCCFKISNETLFQDSITTQQKSIIISNVH